MQKFIFIGPNRVGKSNLILSVAAVLAKLDKKVLVLDTTISQGVKSFFNFNSYVEPKDPLESLVPIIRENFDILFTSTDTGKFNFDKIRKVNLERYDYVLIEGDKDLDESLLKDTEMIYLLQDYDKDTLIKNKEIVNKFKIKLSDLQIIFVNRLEDICDNMYFLSELIPCMEVETIEDRNDDIEISFSEQDYENILESKIDGHIYLSDFSDEYKRGIFDAVNTITEVTPRKFQKIVK